MLKRLSIIIPVFNERATVEELISRVIEVDTGLEHEIILVDDGSTDGTCDIYSEIKKPTPFNIIMQVLVTVLL